MHPKLISQAEMTLDTHDWHAVLNRECSEVDDDHEPSTTADVKELLSLLGQQKYTLDSILSTKMFNSKTLPVSVLGSKLLSGNVSSSVTEIPELIGKTIMTDGYFSQVNEFDQEQHLRIKRKITNYKY